MTPDLPCISVVVIGRNEGDRLTRCFESLRRVDYPPERLELIYVDSASTDRSCEVAAGFGARVVQVDRPRPSAAAARNVGWRIARHGLIQFLDGDTRLDPGWFRKGVVALTDPRVAGAFGRCEELNPRASIYMQVTSFNWYGSPGPARYCGGNALFRREVLLAVGGFNESLIAGEEPELCARIRQRGHVIWRCDEPMIQHDLAMTRFRQYWRRAVRSGWAYLVVAVLCRGHADRLWFRENLATAMEVGLWGMLLIAGIAGLKWWAPLGLLGLVVVRTAWIARRVRFRADGWSSALLYGLNCQFVRIPTVVGQVLGLLYFLRNRTAKIIEYKD